MLVGEKDEEEHKDEKEGEGRENDQCIRLWMKGTRRKRRKLWFKEINATVEEKKEKEAVEKKVEGI